VRKKVGVFAHFIFMAKRHKNTLFTLILNNNIPAQKSLIFCALAFISEKRNFFKTERVEKWKKQA